MKRQFSSLHVALGVIFLVALALRLALFVYLIDEPRKFYFYDSEGYERRAMNLLRYGTFASEAQPPLTPDLDRTPVYPALLAAVFAVTGHSIAAVILLQIFFGSVTAVLTFWLARQLRLSMAVGIIAALIIGLDPLAIMTSNHLLTETLFTTLLVAAVALLVQYWRTQQLRWVIASAICVALTALTRPISQFLPLALLPLFAIAISGQRLRPVFTAGALFVVVSLALTYTWAYRNYRETGLFTLSTISDTNLIYYRARAVLAASQDANQEETWRKIEASIERTVREQQLTTAEKIKLQRKEAIAIFRQYPLLTLSMTAEGAARLLFDPGYTVVCTLLDRSTTSFECFPGKASMNEPGLFDKAFGRLSSMSPLQQLTLLWSTLLLASMYVGSIGGVVRLIRQKKWLTLSLLMLLIVYFIGLAAGAEANSRFRIPAAPFIAILGGLGLESLCLRLPLWVQSLGFRRSTQVSMSGDTAA